MARSSVPTLIIFVKNPVPGQVKTRIAATTGPERALEIYNILLEKARQLALSFQGERLLCYSNAIVDDHWSEADFIKLIQKGEDLGQRMYNALSYALSYSEKAILIGSDCPAITPKILEEAIDALDEKDIVIGPSHDGGYYLIGMKKAIWGLFEDISWSTATVLDDTIKRAKEHHDSLQLLEKLSDIDTEKDWNNYQRTQLSNPNKTT